MRAILALVAANSLLSCVAALDHSTVLSREHRLGRRAKTTTPTCKNGFSLDPTKTTCICREGKVTNVDKSKCLEDCTSGSYKVGDGTCAKCPAPFAKCSSRTVPTGCIDGYFLSGATCVKTCPAGAWGDDAPTKNRCRPCDDKHASSCSKGGATATACSSGYLYNGKCVTLAQVPDGYYADSKTHKTEKCDAEVATCKCRGVGCALTCAKNKKNDQYLLTPKGECKMHCPSGYYGNKKLGLCLPCDSTELTCDAGGANTCAKDSAGTQLILLPTTRKCILPWMGPTGYYADAASASFKPCPAGVTACAGPDLCDALACDQDADGNDLFLTRCGQQKRVRRASGASTGACVRSDNCNVREWPDLATHTCKQCDANEESCTGNGDGLATSCSYPFVLTTNGDCVTTTGCIASGAFYPTAGRNGVCRACDPGVLGCTGNGLGTATSCGLGTEGNQLYLFEGNCYSDDSCPSGTFPDTSRNTCSSCTARFGDDVATCTAEKVTTCTTGVVYNGGCIPECPASVAVLVGSECFLCSDLFAGSSTCDAAGPQTCARNDEGATLYVGGAACVTADQCPTGTYGSDDFGACEECSAFGSFVDTCDREGALTCTGSNILYNGGCFESCPYGTYSDGDSCGNCYDIINEPCTLAQARQCSWMLSEQYGTCVYGCPNNPYGNTLGTYNSGGVCKSCTSLSVDTCTAAGATNCLNPMLLDQGTNSCIDRAACMAKSGTIALYQTNQGRNRGYCTTCTFPTQPNSDRSRCGGD
ncbi:hypothetical protein JCM10449v2_003172 [Rhodotorula kratochvilovae]